MSVQSTSSSLSSLSSSVTSTLRAHPNAITLTAAAAVGLSVAAYHYGGLQPLVHRVLSTVRRDAPRAPFKEEQLLRHVFARAAQHNPQSVLDVMDDFGWRLHWMMAVGDVKGAIVRSEVQQRKPKVAVELGGYCGYSAVLIGAALPPDGRLYSIEIDPLHAAIATKIVEYAGLKDKVTVVVGTVSSKLSALRTLYGVSSIDLLFIDHDKRLYLSDLRLMEQSGLLQPGSVIVADNVIYPGAPDYLDYVRGLEGRAYRTVLHDTFVEYGHQGRDTKDAVAVSVKL